MEEKEMELEREKMEEEQTVMSEELEALGSGCVRCSGEVSFQV